MRHIRFTTADWWIGFDPSEIAIRFPELAAVAHLEFVPTIEQAELLIYSCFPGGLKTRLPKDPLGGRAGGPVRLFYTAENVQPNLRECDFAISFSRTVVDPRHYRMPNSIAALRMDGLDPILLQSSTAQRAPGTIGSRPRPKKTAGELLRGKTRFCTYVQKNPVPFREEFVRRLSAYKTVDCAGPSLNNTGFNVNRSEKHAMYAESKFAVTFENECSLGYTTEKLPDALIKDCVPIYWGDPTVGLDFNEESFIRVRSEEDVDAAIERVIALDRDDRAYAAMLNAPKFPGGAMPLDYQTEPLRQFFERVVSSVVSGKRPAVLSAMSTSLIP